MDIINIIISIVLIFFCLFALKQTRRVYFFSNFYYFDQFVEMKKIRIALKLLNDANVNARLVIRYKANRVNIIFQKKQNSEKWWIELSTNKDIELPGINDSELINYIGQSPSEPGIGDIKKFNVGIDTEKISRLFEGIMAALYNIDNNAEIYIRYRNLRVIKKWEDYSAGG